jgi:ribosome-binding protein aMBF1 (putative translation factor)
MTPDQFRACLDLIGWSQRGLAARLQMDERQVRRWAAGADIPRPIAAWLEDLALFHERHPAPQWRAARAA